MNKIISIGALSLGVSSQQFNWGQQNPCAQAAQSNNIPIDSPCNVAAAPVTQAPVNLGVDAPCGCAQACPAPVAAPVSNLPAQNCCQVAQPCGSRGTSCNSPPKKIVGAKADNPVCSHVRFAWSKPESCDDKITQYQIKVMTAAGQYRELNAIPGSFSVYRVSNAALQAGPFNLVVGTIINWQIRSWDSKGWSDWAAGNSSPGVQAAAVTALPPSAPSRSAGPPNGWKCINSWWDGFQCVNPFGPVTQPQSNANDNSVPFVPTIEKGDNAVVEECAAIPLKKVTIRTVSQPNNRVPSQQRRAPYNPINWNVLQQTCCQLPKPMIPQSCGCNNNNQGPPVNNVPTFPQVDLPKPVKEVQCGCNEPAAQIPQGCNCPATGI